MTDVVGVCDNGFMVIELVERLDAAASELLACLKRGDASSEEMLGVLSGTRAVRGKLDAVQTVAAAGVAGSRNHGDGGAHVLAESTGMSRSDARSQVRTAAAVGAMPAVRDAVEEGRISPANAKRLADALDKTSAVEVESDGELLAKAKSLPPDKFAKEAKRWTAERQGDGGEAEFRRLRARRAVRVWDGDDGMVHLYGQFDPVSGRRIRSRLNKEAHRLLDADNKQARAPADAHENGAGGLLDAGKKQARGLFDGDEDSACGDVDRGRARAGGGGKRSLQQCMADAFENMTAGTAGGGKPYADIALVARLDPEAEKLMVSTGDGDPLPAGVVERLAGESSWFGLVLSAKGVPMWKGRNVRRVTESQFQALMALYGGCAGCGEPDENKVHAHHMDPFAWGGRTDLDNLLPLCWGCHAKIHDHGWRVVAAVDGKHTIRPPGRIHHGPARLPDTAPLLASTEPSQSTAPEPSHSTAPEPSHSIEAESDAGSLFTPIEPRIAPGNNGYNGSSGNASRAGPTGPQAARAALRRARGAQHDSQSVRA
ncbi:MAG: HNH endonuclease [Acidimicrobiaceae bacterium]|nr:HNH endonuclease [Acidimicrobiaceae bacterium]